MGRSFVAMIGVGADLPAAPTSTPMDDNDQETIHEEPIMMRRTVAHPLLALALSLGCSLGVSAQTPDLDYQLIYHRGIEAVIWSMPAISNKFFYEVFFRDFGVTWNDIVVFSRPPDHPRLEVLTANNNVPFLVTVANLRNGPVVVEVPGSTEKAELLGMFVDNWQASIADVGVTGEDKGRGGKYLLLPPGYSNPIPPGYIPSRFEGYVVVLVYQPVAVNGGTLEDAHALTLKTKVYPLAEAANPKPNRFVDGYPLPFHSLPVYDLSWYSKLAEFINDEPVRERDKVMIGMLASLGIERGKPFQPDAKTKQALEAAIADAYRIMQSWFQTPGKSLTPWWPGSQWMGLNMGALANMGIGWTFETENAVWIDQRAADPFFWANYLPKNLGPGQFYLMALRDSTGQLFKGQETYRLRVPAQVPVRYFWSVIIYDNLTKSYICDGLCDTATNRVGLASYEKQNMKLNPDGSVDLYFGVKAPEGFENNWIPSAGKDFFMIVRVYGPEKALLDKTWKMPDVEKVQ